MKESRLTRLVVPAGFVVLISILQSGAVAAQATVQSHAVWHQHYDDLPLDVATPFISEPAGTDTRSIRVSGVWRNRTNYNFWQHRRGAYVATIPCLVHGHIDESNVNNVPRYKFVGNAWTTNPQASQARTQVIRAFEEWSSLQASTSPTTGQRLVTGLGFRMVSPDSAAEIEIGWRRQRTAATTNRGVFADGTVGVTRLTFNASNDWAFGAAATTRPRQMHFYSTALHEIGHLVGLWESRNRESVMIYTRAPGPDGPSFDAIDEATKRVVYALYSAPAGGGAETCTASGLAPYSPSLQRARF